jgi:DnaK suppressor protein
MNIRKQAEYASRIKEKIAELKQHLDEKDAIGDPVSPDSSVGRLSRVDAMQVQEMRLALLRRKREEVVRLESALRLIESGKYGICNGCGKEIPERRLEAVPDAQMCVPCLTEVQRSS